MKSEMKILTITHAGGAPKYGPNMRWYYMGQALREHGVVVNIASSSSFHKYLHNPDSKAGLTEEIIDGLEYLWIRTKPYRARGARQVVNQAEFVLGCYRNMARLLDANPDVVVASSPHPFVIYPAARVARLTGARLIYEVRDLWPEVLLQLGAFSRWHPYVCALRAAESYAVKASDAIVSVKLGDVKYFSENYGMSREKFHYIPNGFLPSKEWAVGPSSVGEVRGRFGTIIGYCGALSAYYELDILLELAQRFSNRPEVGIVIVGKGEKEAELKRSATQRGLGNVVFMGAVEKQYVPAVLDMFDICYVGLKDVAVHNNGISCNKIYEYMHSAKPILGSYRAGHDPVEASGSGLVAAPGDVDELFRHATRLVDDPALRRYLGNKGREHFHANHDFRSVAAHMKELLDELTNGRGG